MATAIACAAVQVILLLLMFNFVSVTILCRATAIFITPSALRSFPLKSNPSSLVLQCIAAVISSAASSVISLQQRENFVNVTTL